MVKYRIHIIHIQSFRFEPGMTGIDEAEEAEEAEGAARAPGIDEAEEAEEAEGAARGRAPSIPPGKLGTPTGNRGPGNYQSGNRVFGTASQAEPVA